MRQQRKQGTFSLSDPFVIVFILGMLFLLSHVLWFFAHTEIAKIYIYVRYTQLWLMDKLAEFITIPPFNMIQHWINEICMPDNKWYATCWRNFSMVTWDEIKSSSFYFNITYFVILLIFCLRMFFYVNKKHPKFRFTKTHNIKSFVEENKEIYPHLNFIIQLDLINKSLQDERFGMSLTTRQFAFKHQLIQDWQEKSDHSWAPKLDLVKTEALFHQQLGKLWMKSSALSTSETLLFAIALPRVVACDPQLEDHAFKKAIADSDHLIAWCWKQFKIPEKKCQGDALSWLTPSINLSYVQDIIKRYISHPNIQHIIKKHAFNRTILFALFLEARRVGVLQPAELRWLRFYDRALWYLLNTIGRQVAFAEAAGVLSHYLYEAKAGIALVEPQLDSATIGLTNALNSFKYLKKDKEHYEDLAKNKPQNI